MMDSDFRLLTPVKLATMAKFYGLKQQGKKQLWVCRKAVVDPRTGDEQQFKRSTKTTDLRLALRRASEWVDDWLAKIHAGKLPTLPISGKGASLDQIESVYLTAATCSLATRKKNLKRLASMLDDMYPGHTFQSLTVDSLDGRLARQWLLQRKEMAERDHLPANVGMCEQAKRGANAIYRQARSVFSRGVCGAYEDAGLRIPAAVREFATQGFLKASEAPPSEQLSTESVAKIMRILPNLRRVRPATWACFLLMFRAGLRNSEAVKARWSWILPTTAGGYVLQLHTQQDYKTKAHQRIVAIAPELVDLLKSVRLSEPRKDEESYLVPAATPHERHIACYRGISKFLRACGVKAVKGKMAYRLRGHAITEIILANGMGAGQEFAGHGSQRTTHLYKGAAIPYQALSMPGQ